MIIIHYHIKHVNRKSAKTSARQVELLRRPESAKSFAIPYQITIDNLNDKKYNFPCLTLLKGDEEHVRIQTNL